MSSGASETRRERLLREVQQAMPEKSDPIDLASLIWVVLPPAWTLELMSACDFGFALTSEIETLEALLAWLVERGILEGRGSQNPAGVCELYKVTTSGRYEIMDKWRAQKRNPQPPSSSQTIKGFIRTVARYGIDFEGNLGEILGSVGERIFRLREKIEGVPDQVWRWAELAAKLQTSGAMSKSAARQPSQPADVFNLRVQTAFEALDSGEILSWIETARPLASLMKNDLANDNLWFAMERADRYMELLQRRTMDNAHLQKYMRRQEFVRAFTELMDGPDDLWALHYLGAGGVGKTMLIRDICVNLTGVGDIAPGLGDEPSDVQALRPRPEVAVARVDFDYLSADYPRLSPELLLWSFAQELRAYDKDGSARSYFENFDSLSEKFHESVSTRKLSPDTPLIRDRQFVNMVRVFIDGLNALKRPVLLILDTCEELAKVRSELDPHENIKVTFKILEALHDGADTLEGSTGGKGVKGLRVIFSGRRMLAKRGSGWSYPDEDLPECSYLRLQELRGFRLPEAEKLTAALNVPQDLRPAVVKASMPEISNGYVIAYTDASRNPDHQSRCNPHQFRLLADWALDSSPPTVEEILLARADRYVEARILNRLGDPALRQILPAAALLGRFDYPLLKATSGLPDGEFEDAYAKLKQQEWVANRLSYLQEQHTQRNFVFEITPGIREQLYVYFKNQGSELRQAQRRGIDYVIDLTLQQSLGDLLWTDLESAFRVLECDLPRAAAWWQLCEARLSSERGWKWIEDTLARLDGDLPSDHLLKPFILASRATALFQLGGSRPAAIWQEVEATIPAGIEFDELRLRANANLLVEQIAGGERGEKTLARLNSFMSSAAQQMHAQNPDVQPEVSPQFAASCLIIFEALVESAEVDQHNGEPARRFKIEVDLLNQFAQSLAGWIVQWQMKCESTPLHKYCYPAATSEQKLDILNCAYLLAARANNLTAAEQGAGFHFANRVIRNLKAESILWPGWGDWRPPADISARVRLELLRVLRSDAAQSPGKILEIIGPVARQHANIDQERLLSAELALRLAQGPISESEITEYQALCGPEYPEAACTAHLWSAPLGDNVAMALAIHGQVAQALGFVKEWPRKLTRAKHLYGWQVLESPRAKIARRMRLGEEGDAYLFYLEDIKGAFEFEQALIWSRQDAPPEDIQPERLAEIHKIWQMLRLRGPHKDGSSNLSRWEATLTQAGRMAKLKAADPALTTNLLLDQLEAQTLSVGGKTDLQASDLILAGMPVSERFSVLLRAYVLSNEGRNLNLNVGAELNQFEFGDQQAGDLAFEAAELLALRLPSQAGALFSLAAGNFEAARAPVGQFLAQLAVSFHQDWTKQAVSSEDQNRLKTLYNQLPASIGLPDWEALLKTAAETDANKLDLLGPREWRPWLLRLIFVLQQCAGQNQPAGAEFYRWVAKNYGRDIPAQQGRPGRELPTEWNYAPALTEINDSPAPIKGEVKEILLNEVVKTPKAWWQRIQFPKIDWSNIGVGIILLLFLLLAVSPLLLIRWMFGSSISSVSNQNPWASIGLYALGLIGAWLAIYVLYRVYSYGRASMLAAGSFDLRINLAGKADTAYEFESFNEQRSFVIEGELTGKRLAARWPVVQDGVTWKNSLTGKTAGFKAPELMIKNVPSLEPLQKCLENLNSGLWRRRLTVWLTPGEQAHADAWEMLIFKGAKPGQSILSPIKDFHLDVVRRVKSGRLRVSNELASNRKILTLTNNALLARLISEKKLGSEQVTADKLVENDAQVVLLFGRTEEYAGGVEFYLVGERSSTQGAAQTIRTTELLGRSPQARLIILGGELLEKYSERKETDRRSAFLARMLAAELAAKGMPYVLVLPPLTRATQENVLSVMQTYLAKFGRAGQEGRNVVKLVQIVRETIFDKVDYFTTTVNEEAGLSRETITNLALEMSLDVCLYKSIKPF